jgi:putative membrane protein
MMVSWDLSFDPVYSTINHSWVWQDGGSYFGVPFGNFLGWLLTTYVFFQLFALYLKGYRDVQSSDRHPSRVERLQAVMFYGLIAAAWNNLTRNVSGTVTDPAGVIWRLQDIYAVTGLIAIFMMGAFTLVGLVKLMGVSPAVQDAATETPSRSPV